MGQEDSTWKFLEVWQGLAHFRGCGLFPMAGMSLPVAGQAGPGKGGLQVWEGLCITHN